MQDIFDSFQKQTLDELIQTTSSRLAKTLPQMKVRLEKAYQRKDYHEVQRCLKQSYEKINHQLSYEMQQLIKRIVFSSEDMAHIQKTETGGNTMEPMIILTIALLIAIVVVAWVVYTHKKSGKNESVSAFIQRNKSKQSRIDYTEKERDMLELIHLIATITNKTDDSLIS